MASWRAAFAPLVRNFVRSSPIPESIVLKQSNLLFACKAAVAGKQTSTSSLAPLSAVRLSFPARSMATFERKKPHVNIGMFYFLFF
jgi:hypothetical protein